MTAYKIQTNLMQGDYLICAIINEAINVNEISKMKSSELNPAASKAIHGEIEERKKQAVKKKYSSAHKCFRCGGRKTTEHEMQSRSLDEGSTLVIRCAMDDCSNVWYMAT